MDRVPEGRLESAPNVTRIVLDPILLQERDEFSLKIVFLVMLRLTGDVGEGGSDLSVPIEKAPYPSCH